MKAGGLDCVIGGSVFSCPPKFRRDRPLKTAENHIFQFLELHNSKSFWPTTTIPIPYESPASVVWQDLLNLSVRPIFSPKMTSENATRDRSQGTFWRKSAKSNPKGHFFFFFFFFFWACEPIPVMQINSKSQMAIFFFEQMLVVPNCEWAHMHIMQRDMYGRI